MRRCPATSGTSAIGFASLRGSWSPRSALASIWTAMTANCGVRSRLRPSSRRTQRCGGVSTPSPTTFVFRRPSTGRPLSPPPAAVNRWNSKKEILIMPQQMIWFFLSIAFSLIAWGIVAARYIWPELRHRERAEALRPLLILHSFRFIGLAFLVPGVVSADLPPAFAHSAAYGDLVAATLALLSLATLPRGSGVVAAWIFNLWGSADLLNAFYQANDAGLVPGQLGVMYFIPTLVVPLLLITHGLAFRILLQHQAESALQGSLPST